jgi:hypothetical protein
MAEGTFVGWVDFGAEDQKRARDYLRAMSTGGTLDELGFGIMRDAFSDVFFPATTTVMTHSRYFIFIPAMYLHIEKMKLSGIRAEKKSVAMEKQLRRVLANNGQISIEKESLKRYPSSVYWRALRTLQVFNFPDWPQAYYQDQLKGYSSRQKGMTDDDGNVHVEGAAVGNWDPEVVELSEFMDALKLTADGEYPDSTLLDLTAQEAAYLKSKYEHLAERQNMPSLMSHILTHELSTDFKYPWQLKYPMKLDKYIRHAECFSMLAKSALLVYSAMIVDKLGERGLDFSEPLSLWWETAREDVCEWNMEAFLHETTEMNAVRGHDKDFFTDWQRSLSDANTPQQFLSSETTKRLIRHRECDKRPTKARLKHPKYLKQWKAPRDLKAAEYTNPYEIKYSLEFRSRIAGRLAGEIVEGLSLKNTS